MAAQSWLTYQLAPTNGLSIRSPGVTELVEDELLLTTELEDELLGAELEGTELELDGTTLLDTELELELEGVLLTELDETDDEPPTTP